MAAETLYWYDYETFGTDPARDRPAQFAGLRTDLDFNPLDDPLVLYCRPTPDYLPQPDACLITGITPQIALAKGVHEAEFIQRINAEFSVPSSCVLGYNSLRFDDEVTRYTLYRNLMDPYAREWRNGNSRWDLIDVARMTAALRPEGIEWPLDEAGKKTFKLDRLTVANGIEHQDAHDALADVKATIALARMLKQRQPRLFDYLWKHRGKRAAANLLGLGTWQPLVHASGRFSAEKGSIAVIVALAQDPGNPNGVVCYDLSVDPEPMLSLAPEALRERLYTSTADLPAGVNRIPLKNVHLNKCPALAPISVIRPEDAQRLKIDLEQCKAHLAQLRQAPGLVAKIQATVTPDGRRERSKDPDLMLYDGFIGDTDRWQLEHLRMRAPTEMAQLNPEFVDERLPELVFRYRARNFPETLAPEEATRWMTFCRERLTGHRPGASLTVAEYEHRIRELEQLHGSSPHAPVLRALREYLATLPS